MNIHKNKDHFSAPPKVQTALSLNTANLFSGIRSTEMQGGKGIFRLAATVFVLMSKRYQPKIIKFLLPDTASTMAKDWKYQNTVVFI